MRGEPKLLEAVGPVSCPVSPTLAVRYGQNQPVIPADARLPLHRPNRPAPGDAR